MAAADRASQVGQIIYWPEADLGERRTNAIDLLGGERADRAAENRARNAPKQKTRACWSGILLIVRGLLDVTF